MKFIDEVNLARPEYISPQEKAQIEKKKENEELLELIQKIANAIKSMIVTAAKNTPKGTNFFYKGFILQGCSADGTKYVHTDKKIKQSFFSSDSKQDITFSTTEEARVFYELLKTELIKDSIILNDYKLMFGRKYVYAEDCNLCVSYSIDDFLLIAGDSGSDLLSLDGIYPFPCTWHIGSCFSERYDSIIVDSKKVFECRGNMNVSGIYLCLSFEFKG